MISLSKLISNLRQRQMLKENEELIKEFNELKVSNGSIIYYKLNVFGNRGEDNNVLENKLKRNFLCGKQIFKNDSEERRAYGNLTIGKNRKTNTITFVSNFRTAEDKACPFIINEGIKDILDIYIGVK